MNHKILTGTAGAKFALQSFELFEKPTHISYLKSGWSVQLVAAIDFTASNGDPLADDSNHSLSQGMNDYEKALYNVGEVIEGEYADPESETTF